MTAIVMNTTSAAVTEYGDSFAFNSISSTHAASADGLFSLGGTQDNGEEISASWLGPQLGGLSVRRPEQVYVGVRGEAGSRGMVRIVAGGKKAERGTEWNYDLLVRSGGISRCAAPGKGIRENYLAYGYANVDGAPYVIGEFRVEEFLINQRKAT